MSEPEIAIAKKPALMVVSQGRPAYPVRAKDAFGIMPGDWRALVDAVWPAAQTTEAVELALSYCRARKLDPFKRPVHIVPVWDTKRNGYVETIWPGIGELRTTASRTGQWAGVDDAEFGPEISRTFKGVVKKGTEPIEKTVVFPEWCQVTVYKIIQGQRVPWKGPRVRWLETYASMGRSDVPNEMWESRPYGQLEKCAEAAALRRAFPEEVGNEYIPEEAGRSRMVAIETPAIIEAPTASRSEALLQRLQGETAGIATTVTPADEAAEDDGEHAPEPDRAPEARQEAATANPAALTATQEELVEQLRQLLLKHGLKGEAREAPLEAAFGTPSWVRVCKLKPDQLVAGIVVLTRLLGGEAAAADNAAGEDREPGED